MSQTVKLNLRQAHDLRRGIETKLKEVSISTERSISGYDVISLDRMDTMKFRHLFIDMVSEFRSQLDNAISLTAILGNLRQQIHIANRTEFKHGGDILTIDSIMDEMAVIDSQIRLIDQVIPKKSEAHDASNNDSMMRLSDALHERQNALAGKTEGHRFGSASRSASVDVRTKDVLRHYRTLKLELQDKRSKLEDARLALNFSLFIEISEGDVAFAKSFGAL